MVARGAPVGAPFSFNGYRNVFPATALRTGAPIATGDQDILFLRELVDSIDLRRES